MMNLEKKRTLPKKPHVGALAGSLGLPREAWAPPLRILFCHQCQGAGKARGPLLEDQHPCPESLVLYLQIPQAAWPWLRQLRGAASWAPPTLTPHPP